MDAATRIVALEMSTAPITAAIPMAARYAETAAMLRFGGGVQSWTGGMAVTATFGLHSAAVRLRGEIVSLHGLHARAVASRDRRISQVQVLHGAGYLAQRTGLVDSAGQRRLDLPLDPATCTFSEGDATVRAAFLARGVVSATTAADGHSDARWRVTLGCPSGPAARWLHRYLLRHGIKSHMLHTMHNGRSTDRVEIRKPQEAGELLLVMGAHAAHRRLIVGKESPARLLTVR